MLTRENAFAWPLLAAMTMTGAARLQADSPPTFGTSEIVVSEAEFVPLPAANPPHWVLEQPAPVTRHHGSEMVVVDELGNVAGHPGAAHETAVHPSAAHSSSAHNDPRQEAALGAHFIHAEKMPRPTAIPGATRKPMWKTPYSYGHFGAARNRQWSHHRGHQQDYLQWTLK